MRDCTIYVAKTKAPISFAVTANLICVFVYAYAKSRFSHEETHLMEDKTYLKIHYIVIPPQTVSVGGYTVFTLSNRTNERKCVRNDLLP